MPLPTIDNAVRISAEGVYQGHPFANVFHVHAADAANLQTVLQDFAAAWQNNIVVKLSDQLTMQRYVAIRLDDQSVGSVIAAPNTNKTGTDTATTRLPANVSMVISWHTAQRGRRNRGRTFVTGLTENRLEDGDASRLFSGFTTEMDTAAEAFLVQLEAAGWGLRVASYVTPDITTVTGATINPRVCTQRRRLDTR